MFRIDLGPHVRPVPPLHSLAAVCGAHLPGMTFPPRLFSLHAAGDRTTGSRFRPPNLGSGGRARVGRRAVAVRRARNAAPRQPPRNISDAAVPLRYLKTIGSIVKMFWTHR